MLCATALALAAPWQIAAAPTASEAELLLLASIAEIRASRLDRALTHLEQLTRQYPNYRLAHLIRGDVLMARAKPLARLGDAPGERAGARLDELRAEALARAQRLMVSEAAHALPAAIVQFAPHQQSALVVDASRSRLYVFKNNEGRPEPVADYYVTIGKLGAGKVREGDRKTPVGVYHVTSEMPKARLTDFYGSLALPLNYPNEWDRREGRTGHGIWIHGVPSDTYSRPPQASDGCVVLANEDLVRLRRHIDVGTTPVIITPRVDWQDPAVWQAENERLAKAIEQWRQDWESRDSRRYLSHYTHDFVADDGADFAVWSQRKQQVNSSKTWVKVQLSSLSLYRYRGTGQPDVAVATFDQFYQSNNLEQSSRKRQYWRLSQDGRWQIAYEGSVDESGPMQPLLARADLKPGKYSKSSKRRKA